ncbi:recombinase family protein [Candidatus Parcubacteria bacterium]|nr:recombinase family protein [Candidatus Parcubacteria bacterium]
MKKVVIYTRVSSDEQVKGCSLDIQEEQLKKLSLTNYK